MEQAEVVRSLRTLGLTDYEAKAYSCLADRGILEAGHVSKLAQIPHSKTYEVLMRLERRGLIEVQRGRPMMFKPIHPSKAIEKLESELRSDLQRDFLEKRDILERGHEQRMEELTKAKELALGELKRVFDKVSETESSDDLVWAMRGAENIIDQMRDFVRDARNEIQLMLPRDEFKHIEESLRLASSRGVKVIAIVHSLSEEAYSITKYARVFHGRVSPSRFGIALVDGQRAMFITEDFQTGLKTTGKSMLVVLSHFFEHEKEESTPLPPIGST